MLLRVGRRKAVFDRALARAPGFAYAACVSAPMHGHSLRLVVLPAVFAALLASLMLATPASAGLSKGAYIKALNAFGQALEYDMSPVANATSLAAARAAFPAAKARLAKAERALRAVTPPAGMAADQKSLVTDATVMINALDVAYAGKLYGVTAAKNAALQAALKRAGDKVEDALVKIENAGYALGG